MTTAYCPAHKCMERIRTIRRKPGKPSWEDKQAISTGGAVIQASLDCEAQAAIVVAPWWAENVLSYSAGEVPD